MVKGHLKMQYNTAASVVKSAIAVEKAVREANLLFAQHECNLKQAKTYQAYNFAYKTYENDFYSIRSYFLEAASSVNLLESKIHYLSGLSKITAMEYLRKIKKLTSVQLAKTKIPKMEVG